MSLTSSVLTTRQNYPLDMKIEMSTRRIQEFYDYFGGLVYISFSGGADSRVLLDLIKEKAGLRDVPVVYCNTGLEYPEVHHIALKYADTILQPRYTFKEEIEKYGWPIVSKEQAHYIYQIRNTKSEYMRQLRLNGRAGSKSYKLSEKWKFLLDAPFKISAHCCDTMKKNPAKKYENKTGRHPYLGTMAEESSLRKQAYLKTGCNAFNLTRPHSAPLSFWRKTDVIEYLLKYNLDYAEVYGDIIEENKIYKFTGEPRTGCVFCAFGCQYEEEPNKFQRLKKTHPKLYDYCMNILGEAEVLDFMNIPH